MSIIRFGSVREKTQSNGKTCLSARAGSNSCFFSCLAFLYTQGRIGRKARPIPDPRPGSRADSLQVPFLRLDQQPIRGDDRGPDPRQHGIFQWLHDEYGMKLDVYSLDVGNIDDGPYTAASVVSFPIIMDAGFPGVQGPISARLRALVRKAAGFGGRLGVWMARTASATLPRRKGPHGHADLALPGRRLHRFKFDAVAGQLRPEKQIPSAGPSKPVGPIARSHCPEHRVKLGAAEGVATVSLWKASRLISTFSCQQRDGRPP